jgi:hypothetical protein
VTITYVEAQSETVLARFTFGSGDAIPSVGDEVVIDEAGAKHLLRVVRRRFTLAGSAPTNLEIVLDSAVEVGRVGL